MKRNVKNITIIIIKNIVVIIQKVQIQKVKNIIVVKRMMLRQLSKIQQRIQHLLLKLSS
jgi:hypothetical protein